MKMNKQKETIRIAFLGQTNVGKTSLVNAFLHKNHELTQTYIMEVQPGLYDCGDGSKVSIECWDFSGKNEDKQKVDDALFYLKKMDAIVFVYDVGNQYSFKMIDSWGMSLKMKAIFIQNSFLIGNKIDLVKKDRHSRKVSIEEGREKAKSIGISGAKFAQISAFQKQGVDFFSQILDEVFTKKYYQNMKKDKIKIDIIIEDSKSKQCGQCHKNCQIF